MAAARWPAPGLIRKTSFFFEEAMSEETLQERELSIEDYLKLFSEMSVDYIEVKSKADKIKSITLRTVRAPDGQLFEDTTFFEKSGIRSSIRVKL